MAPGAVLWSDERSGAMSSTTVEGETHGVRAINDDNDWGLSGVPLIWIRSMKMTQKDLEKVGWDPMRNPSGAGAIAAAGSQNRALPKFMVWLILFVSVTYVVYTLKLVSSSSRSCDDDFLFTTTRNRFNLPDKSLPNSTTFSSESPSPVAIQNRAAGITTIPRFIGVEETRPKTELKHIMFGIAGSAKLWDKRKNYLKLWWKPDEMRGVVWLDRAVKTKPDEGLPEYDVYGNLFGLLAAHPVAPLVSMHHLDVVEPIFPNVTRVEALQRLQIPMKLDSAGLIQQSICYDGAKKWTVSVSWGFAIQVFRGILSPREIEMPSRTFLNWYRRADYTAYAFNTRPVSRNPCQKPFVFYMSNARLELSTNRTVSVYSRHRVAHPACRWKMPDPDELDRVVVYKKPDPHLWDRSPRRNCCRIMNSKRRNLVVDVGVCREGEVSEI
ncbi:hypothetical protein U1Q18_019664 [Sarracenia purpurea var. burkii]